MITVKVAGDGTAYVDGRAVEAAELDSIVAALVGRGGGVDYYRERPTGPGSEAANATFKRLVAHRPAIRLGHLAPPQWGTLTWFELEQSPGIARVFFARGERFLVSVPEIAHAIVGGPLDGEAEARLFSELDMLACSDRVIETPPNEPQRAFSSAPGMHLRLAYDTRRWASWWPLDAIPGNLRSLRADLGELAVRLARTPGRTISSSEARSFFPPSP